jgi:ribosomal protein L37AE/L43A
MGAKSKKIKASGKFGSRVGILARKEYNAVEAQQRKVQKSPFHPRGKAIRVAAGIWKCNRTGKVFAGPAYFLEDKNK